MSRIKHIHANIFFNHVDLNLISKPWLQHFNSTLSSKMLEPFQTVRGSSMCDGRMLEFVRQKLDARKNSVEDVPTLEATYAAIQHAATYCVRLCKTRLTKTNNVGSSYCRTC